MIWPLTIVVLLFLGGCGDFFSEKPTELESEKILRHLNTIDGLGGNVASAPKISAPEPKIIEQKVGGASEFKLFYVGKNHTSQELSDMINKQFATQLFNEKGKSTQIKDYTITSNIGTNQVIVRCPLLEDAQAVLAFLEHADIAPTQVKIDCLISEVYADVTMDWETTTLIENLFGENISLGGKVNEDGQLLPAFPGAALRDAARATFGLKAGFVMNEGVDGHEFRALVDLLVSRGYLKILMNPTLEVVNGETAKISATERVPLDEMRDVNPQSNWISYTTRYEDVVDSLEITPHVYANGYIGLETHAILGSKSTPEGVKQLPIVTKRQIDNKENRIRQGESLVIGGLRKTEKRAVVRGVPFLKDLPLIGVLFSSKDFEERGKEVLFIITPTVSTGGIPHKNMIADMEKTHTNVKHRGMTDVFLDPFGGSKDDDPAPTSNDMPKTIYRLETDQVIPKNPVVKETKKPVYTAPSSNNNGTVTDGLNQILNRLNSAK